MTPREERFWSHVDRSGGPEACWLWTAYRQRAGYGQFDHTSAHRFSLELRLGRAIGPGMFACHRCDNPPCVNPAHLFEGSAQDNVADRHAKRRDAIGLWNGRVTHPERTVRGDLHPARRIPGFRAGTRNGRHRLTEDDVRIIRQRLAAGVRWIDIAVEFGVAKPTVSHIAAGRTWQHVA